MVPVKGALHVRSTFAMDGCCYESFYELRVDREREEMADGEGWIN